MVIGIDEHTSVAGVFKTKELISGHDQRRQWIGHSTECGSVRVWGYCAVAAAKALNKPPTLNDSARFEFTVLSDTLSVGSTYCGHPYFENFQLLLSWEF